MDQDMKPPEQSNQNMFMPKTNKKSNMYMSKKTIYILIAIVVLAAFAAGAFLIRDKMANDFEKTQSDNISTLEKANNDLNTQLATERSKNAILTTNSTSVAPSADVIASIEAAITSGNTSALTGYMAASVGVVNSAVYVSPYATPDQAVSFLSDFLASGGNTSLNYNFSLSASTLATYRSNALFNQYFPNNAIIGKSDQGKVISISFDNKSKISTIFYTSSESDLMH